MQLSKQTSEKRKDVFEETGGKSKKQKRQGEESACLICIKNGNPKYSLCDRVKSTIDRHIGRQHPTISDKKEKGDIHQNIFLLSNPLINKALSSMGMNLEKPKRVKVGETTQQNSEVTPKEHPEKKLLGIEEVQQSEVPDLNNNLESSKNHPEKKLLGLEEFQQGDIHDQNNNLESTKNSEVVIIYDPEKEQFVSIESINEIILSMLNLPKQYKNYRKIFIIQKIYRYWNLINQIYSLILLPQNSSKTMKIILLTI